MANPLLLAHTHKNPNICKKVENIFNLYVIVFNGFILKVGKNFNFL
jgi:hypothetical protein